MTPSAPRLVSCDEAGYTGPDLTNEVQPVFAYAAHDLSIEEAADLVAGLRGSRRRRIQAPELKATGLRGRDDWPEVAALILAAMEGRYLTIAMDKRMSLAAKTFEYIVEPVIAENSLLFYENGLHRFVAASAYEAIKSAYGPAEPIAAELEAFMRSFDPGDAPTIFGRASTVGDQAETLNLLLRFARGYRERIAAASVSLRKPSATGKWALDLTSTCLTSLLADGFGRRHDVIEALCDESKPLTAIGTYFDAWVDRPEPVPVHGGNRIVEWRLNLAKPLTFGRSIDHPTLQLADVIAGITAEVHGAPERNALAALRPAIDRHLHANHILPDGGEPFGITELAARVNQQVLRHMVRRAEGGADPIRGMRAVYAAAVSGALPGGV